MAGDKCDTTGTGLFFFHLEHGLVSVLGIHRPQRSFCVFRSGGNQQEVGLGGALEVAVTSFFETVPANSTWGARAREHLYRQHLGRKGLVHDHKGRPQPNPTPEVSQKLMEEVRLPGLLATLNPSGASWGKKKYRFCLRDLSFLFSF